MTFPVSIKGVVIHAGKVLLYEWELHVFIATYGCHATATPEPVVSDEHVTAHLFSDREIPTLNLPAGYRRSITTWFNAPRAVT